MDHKFETSKTFEGPAGNSYAELTVLREQERADAIRQGLIDDPDRPKALEEAQIFRGICMDMCPLYEREQREYQNDVKRWEVDPRTGRIDKQLAVKAFHRPAAGNEQALPSDVRPPQVLSQTLAYLVESIVSPSDPLDKDTHGFVRDRTRSIRQDFTLQNERGAEAIACHERIVRFHILSLHHMCEIDGFDAHQEMEQLRKTLQSLAEYYDDQREYGMNYPHEAEFRAYHILTRLRDPDVLRHTQTLPREIRRSPPVIQALQLYRYAQRSNEEIGRFKPPNSDGSMNLYTKFFKLVGHKDTSYIMACLCEPQFNDVRKGALKSLRKAFISAVKSPSVDELVVLLGCDDQQEVETQCEQYGVVVRPDEEGISRPVLNKSVHFDESRPDLRQKFSRGLVEAKRGGLSFAEIIKGSNVPITAITSPVARSKKDVSTNGSFTFNRSAAVPNTFARPAAVSVPTATLNASMQFGGPVLGGGGHHIAAVNTQPKPLESQNWNVANPPATRQSQFSLPVETDNASRIAKEKKVEVEEAANTSTITTIATSVAQTMVQQMIHETLQDLIKKNIAEQEDIQLKRAGLTNQLSKELFEGLVRDHLYTVVNRTYADWWRNKQTLRNTWRAIKASCLNVQRRRENEAAMALAEQKRQQDYATAFRELYQDQPVVSRKRRRSHFASSNGATTTSLLQAKDNSQKFWSPLDLHHYLPRVQLSETTKEWKILVTTKQSESSSSQWFRTKFGCGGALSGQQHSVIERNHTIKIEVVHDVKAVRLAETAALIFECSENADVDADRLRLLSLVQRIADESDRRFPMLIIRFGSIANDMELAQSLMIPEVLGDRKSPVISCDFVGIESMADVCKFDTALDNLFSSTDSAPSALAVERAQVAERDIRRAVVKQEQLKRQEKTPKLRSSFYDTAVLSPVAPNTQTVKTSLNQTSSHDFMPVQISELMKSVQKSRELLSRSVG